MLREGYNADLLYTGYQTLLEELELDVLLIDTPAGLNEGTLRSIAFTDTLAIVLRPDKQDYQGTAVMVDVTRRLGVPQVALIINKMPPMYDPAEVKAQAEQAFGCEVAAVLPHSDEMLALASAGIFVLCFPHHPLTDLLKQVTARLMA